MKMPLLVRSRHPSIPLLRNLSVAPRTFVSHKTQETKPRREAAAALAARPVAAGLSDTTIAEHSKPCACPSDQIGESTTSDVAVQMDGFTAACSLPHRPIVSRYIPVQYVCNPPSRLRNPKANAIFVCSAATSSRIICRGNHAQDPRSDQVALSRYLLSSCEADRARTHYEVPVKVSGRRAACMRSYITPNSAFPLRGWRPWYRTMACSGTSRPCLLCPRRRLS